VYRKTLIRKSLWHFRSATLAIGLGVATAAAVITGALIVGDSMQASLRRLALARLGGVHIAARSSAFFSEDLATDEPNRMHAPLIQSPATVAHAESRRRSNGVQIYGVDHRFWKLVAGERPTPPDLNEEDVAINARLARELGAEVGDEILIRLGRHQAIPVETLLGRRDATTTTMRRRITQILPDEGPGGFSLRPAHAPPLNLFVALGAMQKTLKRASRVNTILYRKDQQAQGESPFAESVGEGLANRLSLDDLGLTLRTNEAMGYVALESSSLLIAPAMEQAALAAGGASGTNPVAVLTYLANEIAIETTDNGSKNVQAIPYSTVSAVDPILFSQWRRGAPAHQQETSLGAGQIVLTDWAAEDLGAKLGDRITLTYLKTADLGELETGRETFRLSGILELSGAVADSGFSPTYPGITDTRRISDWDPPFPFDLAKIRDKDERYWDQHHATPKAFISLEDGRRLWAENADRFGSLTSVRFYPGDETTLALFFNQLARGIAQRVGLNDAGIVVTEVRDQALTAGSGSTDFGQLFLGFSFFLIAGAALLVVLLTRLGIARRARQIGLLMALGFTPALVRRLLILEGLLIAVVGSAVGQLAAIGFAWFMLAGLKTWWSGAVHAPFLTLHISPATILIGYGCCVAVALLSIAIALRPLRRATPHRLLGGSAAHTSPAAKSTSRHTGQKAIALFAFALLAAAASLMGDPPLPPTALFFASGGLSLLACLCVLSTVFRSKSRFPMPRPGWTALARLGMRNATRQADRSIITATLLASSTFLLASIQAFYVNDQGPTQAKNTPDGGFQLYAESAVPLPYPLDAKRFADDLNLSDETVSALAEAHVVGFRLSAGEAAGCTNLYRPTQPRIIGADDRMLARGGFAFAGTLAETDEERANPWLLLNRRFEDGAIAAIGDQNAVLWQLHSGLGKDFPIRDEYGKAARLKFVALLKGSVLQDELIVSEADFKRLFPSNAGHGFFLIQAPPGLVSAVESGLERDLEPFGLDIGHVEQRLRNYNAVQNTYLATFQTLGGFGLVLGSLGLVAIMLRHILERRRELALMQALGFTRRALAGMVLAENALVLGAGMAAGLGPALIAVIPQLLRRGVSFPWESVVLTLGGVILLGLGAGAVALIPALRVPLVPALRME